jgi:hypothetical protein
MDDLIDMCAQFARVYSNAPDQARKNPNMERKSIEMLGLDAEWQACKELSNLFSCDPVGMTTSDVADWFVKVGSFMSKLSTDSTKALIKQKVQQFCGAVIPEKLALDDHVLIVDGTRFRRDQLWARYEKFNAGLGDKDRFKRLPLSSYPAGLNERTHGDQKFSPPGYEPSMIDTPAELVPADLFKPTPRSAAAFDYFKARQQVPSENGWKRVAGADARSGGGVGENGRSAVGPPLAARGGETEAVRCSSKAQRHSRGHDESWNPESVSRPVVPQESHYAFVY